VISRRVQSVAGRRKGGHEEQRDQGDGNEDVEKVVETNGVVTMGF
jgi:hypothetical protein